MIFLLFVFLLSFQTAVFAEKIALVTDPYWNEILEKESSGGFWETIIKKIIRFVPFYEQSAIRIDGKRVEKIVIEITDSEGTAGMIGTALAADSADIVIMSPLLSAYACSAAEKFSDRDFIVTGFLQDSDCEKQNISIFGVDYSSAFLKAGEWAAAQSESVHALFFTGGNKYRDDAESFKQGWLKLKGADELQITEFSRLDDADADFIAAFEAPLLQDGGIAVLFAGPENETAASRLDGAPVSLVTEHAEIWADSGYDIAASVEAGPSVILASILKSISTETYRNGGAVEADFFVYE